MDAKKATEIVREYLRPFAYFKPLSSVTVELGIRRRHYIVRVNIGLLEDKILEFDISDEGKILRGR